MSRFPFNLLVAVAMLAFLPATGTAQPASGSLQVRCSWLPPTTGSPAVKYHLQIQDPRVESTLDTIYVVLHQGSQGPVPQEFVFTDGDFWQHYRARVRAEDALGRQGPWSSWSEVAVFEVVDPEP